MTDRGRRSFAIASLLALSLIHLSALGGWWLTDDPQILTHAVRESPLSVLFSSHAYRYLSSSSFTPLQTISFDLDYALAGVAPKLFYAHQLLAVAATAVALFFLVERWAGLAGGWIAAATFLIAPQTVLAARSLMLRHYVEGLLFSSIALLLWRRSSAGDGPPFRAAWSDVASALMYLGAMLSKEFYAPLPLLLLVIAIAERMPVREVVRRLVPHAVAASGFIAWRTAILGSIGGYGGTSMGTGFLNLPQALWRAIVGADEWPMPVVAFALLLAITLAAARRSRRTTAAYAFLGALFLALPLIAVANDFQFRYAFASCAALAAGSGLSVDRRGKWTLFAPVAMLLILAASGFSHARRFPRETTQMVAEGKYVWAQPRSAAPLLAYSPGWYLVGLEWLRVHEQRGEPPVFVLSANGVLLRGLDPRAVVTSHPDEERMRPLDAGAIAAIAGVRARLDRSLPLSLEIERRDNDVRWKLGPAGASFEFLSLPHYEDVALPATGWRRQPEPAQREQFRIRRQVPDGRWCISPPLYFPRAGEVIQWRNPAGSM